MFGSITVPYDSVMLWNVCTLKDGVNFVDVEEAIGVVCNTSKEESHGFICGQVFSYAGFLSEEGSFMDTPPEKISDHFLLVRSWHRLATSQALALRLWNPRAISCTHSRSYEIQWAGRKRVND